jgi:glycosyltransferase involved in cell wall biosynthesis
VKIPNCEVIGPSRPQDLNQYYQSASVFCLPTYLEPFGIVFLEAMKARLPIVATRVGAIPDFVEEGRNGWLVEPGDVTGLADGLLRLLQNPRAAQQFGARSYEIIKEHYSWETVGERLRQNIAEMLIGEHGVPVR